MYLSDAWWWLVFRGFLRQIRPYAKYTDVLIERLLGGKSDIDHIEDYDCDTHLVGSKFTINTTNILLMAVIILLICLILEGSSNDKTKRVVVVGKKNSDHDDKKNE